MEEPKDNLNLPLFYTTNRITKEIVFSSPIAIAYLALLIITLFIFMLIIISVTTVFGTEEELNRLYYIFNIFFVGVNIFAIINFIASFMNYEIKNVHVVKHFILILCVIILTVLTSTDIKETIIKHDIVTKKYEAILESRFGTKLGLYYSREALYSRYTKEEINSSFKKYYMDYGVEKEEPIVNTLELELGEFKLY